jgi:hypothetical protein
MGLLHFRRVKWALRKVHLPVAGGVVLDVGSGGKPYPRSDVLLDRMTGAEHRCGAAMMIDRPAVFGDASKMPFKDKSFDFVIASHILEHMADPAVFLGELSRVGRAGYIETPNVIFERLHPYSIHCLEVVSVNNILHIHKKQQPVEDCFLGGLEFLQNDPKWKSFFYEEPDMFHVRHFWTHKIEYQIHNPELSCEWIEAINAQSEVGEIKQSYLDEKPGWREWGLKALGAWHKWRRAKRLKGFDLLSILACPECKGELQKTGDVLCCEVCKVSYPANPYPDFTHPL